MKAERVYKTLHVAPHTTTNTAGSRRTRGMEQEQLFELRHNQIYVKEAQALTIEEMVKDQQRTKYSLSRADIILIFTVYGTLDSFVDKYKAYVNECAVANYSYCQPPHYFLKYQIG